MRVGVLGYRFDHYSYVRNIIGKVPGVEYCKTKDLYARLNAAAQLFNRLTKRTVLQTFDLNHQFYDFNLNNVDLVHLYNGISYGGTPWVSTFETILPRFRNVVEATHGANPAFVSEPKLLKGIERLASNDCKKLIAMSDCAANIQRALLANFNQYSEMIDKKLVVIHPPQQPLVSSFEDKQIDLDGSIKFMFVGNAFFRKGGREAIETLKELRDDFHYDISLTIVSDLRMDGYATNETEQDVHYTVAFMQENQSWISYFKHLPNVEVMEKMKAAHIGLLPSYADSYGYSVLEFQASGCPMITTDIRALPEINDNNKGWIIKVPKNRLGEAIYSTEADRLAISMAIRQGLQTIVHEIFADKGIIREKAELTILSIKTNHSMENFASRMKAIYAEAIW
jgi:glycosyltransferase involved in cell wall biosynthesis